jgi:hypothetical protein
MEISIISHEKKGHLLIVTKAIIENKEGLLAQSQMVYEEIIKHSFKKILVDERETILPNDLVPYFDLVKNYMDNFPPEIRELKIATVVAEEYKEFSDTWETLCMSRGLNFNSFTSYDEAEQWLLSENDSE